VNSGHWELRKRRKRLHIRWSTVLYTERAHRYEAVEPGLTTSQTLYFDLSAQKRKQLYRAYLELVTNVECEETPEKSFLSREVVAQLEDVNHDLEKDNRLGVFKLLLDLIYLYKYKLLSHDNYDEILSGEGKDILETVFL